MAEENREEPGNYVLELGCKRIDFQPVSKDVSVFYDESNKQVFIVISQGKEGIIVKGADDYSQQFSLPDAESILSIKFSPTFEILSLQRSLSHIEFLVFRKSQVVQRFTHVSKSKNSKILGFFWSYTNEIVIVTDAGVEFFQVFPDKGTLKSIKSFSLTVEWFVYQHVSCILLVANGTFGNVIHPFLFRPSNVYKLNRFEVDWTHQAKASNSVLQERDVTMGNIYGKPRLLVLRHQPPQSSKEQSGARILVYTFHKRDSPPSKTDVLLTNLSGRFAINIVDDLIVVHHRSFQSKSSLIFDMNLQANEIVSGVKYHLPIIPKCQIKPYKINDVLDYELYSPNWVIFQPNIIIDAKYGCLWFLEINLHTVFELIQNVPIMIDFLLLRKHSKSVILRVCRSVVRMSKLHHQNAIGNLSLLFNKLNLAYRESIQVTEKDANSGGSTNSSVVSANSNSNSDSFDYIKHKIAVTIDQKDMLTHFFDHFQEDGIEERMRIAILFEYIASLTANRIPIQYFIYELLINHLIQNGNFYQMHQFLQYHVFSDSKHLACLLLSLHTSYPFAIQLGLDMLKRLGDSNEEIVEVLLSQNQIVRALEYVEANMNINSVSARKFLEAAYNTRNPTTFQQVYKALQLRNLKLRGSPNFVSGENCELYERHFEHLFGTNLSFLS